MRIDRRAALGLLGCGVTTVKLKAALRHLSALQSNPGAYRALFFEDREMALLDRLAEMIIPADQHSLGAHEAKVNSYIDLVVGNSPASVQANWRKRLAAFDGLAQEKHGKPFLNLDASTQAALLNWVCRNEKSASSPAELFFVDVKKVTIFAYYTSPIGLLKELGYKGNEVLGEFPGCAHTPSAHSY